jgi:signal transduction histidine kinase
MKDKSNPNQSTSFLREVQIEYLIHELKSPITIVETGLRSLLEKKERYGTLSAKQEKTLNRALRNSKKMREMLNNLLEVGRSEAGCFESCRFQPVKVMQKVLEETLDALPEKDEDLLIESKDLSEHLKRSGIHFDISSNGSSTEIYQDVIKFRQIFGNLIRNALYHRKEQITVRVQQDDECLLVDVIDDGPGVKPEHRDMIFKRYVHPGACSVLDRRGHGLGLAGSLIMARYLGGDIKLISKRGKGATFRLILPISFECKT